MNKKAYCYKKLKNDDLAFNRLHWLCANWANMNSLELAERFSKLSEAERNTFNLGMTLDETVAFSEKLLEGDNQRVNEIRERVDEQKEMVHKAFALAEQAQEDRREVYKDWALFSYIKDLDFDGEFEAEMVKLAVKWCEENDLHVDEADREDFMTLVREHVERAGEAIERFHGKDAVDNFMNEVAPYLS